MELLSLDDSTCLSESSDKSIFPDDRTRAPLVDMDTFRGTAELECVDFGKEEDFVTWTLFNIVSSVSFIPLVRVEIKLLSSDEDDFDVT